MRFLVEVTAGGEVVFAGNRRTGPVYYGAQPETGRWRLSIPKFQDFVSAKLLPFSFGESVEEFRMGLEIAELSEWGDWFKKTATYVSYRPKSKVLVSVGQLDWRAVKDLSAEDQLTQLKAALMMAIARIEDLKRKPKHFDQGAFSAELNSVLALCTSGQVVVDQHDA
jgi:hypothetical protein